MKSNRPNDTDDRGPDAFDATLRACIAAALRELRLSASQNRTISLPNLRRLFDCRWNAAELPPAMRRLGREIGRKRISIFYLSHQPIRY